MAIACYGLDAELALSKALAKVGEHCFPGCQIALLVDDGSPSSRIRALAGYLREAADEAADQRVAVTRMPGVEPGWLAGDDLRVPAFAATEVVESLSNSLSRGELPAIATVREALCNALLVQWYNHVCN